MSDDTSTDGAERTDVSLADLIQAKQKVEKAIRAKRDGRDSDSVYSISAAKKYLDRSIDTETEHE